MKYKTLVVAPVFTRSGYGEYARDVISHLMADGRFDLTVVPTRWGDTPMNAVPTAIEEQIVDEGLVGKPLDRQPELMFEVSVPPEFGRLVTVRGRKNFGLTAGLESTICPPDWIAGVNRSDVVFATSEYAKRSLLASYKLPNGSALKAEKPVEVVPMGVDPEIFGVNAPRDDAFQRQLDATIKEDRALLFVGHWLPGNIGEDRKDVGRLIALFTRAFQGKKNVCLVLKTSTGTHSKSDELEIRKRIEWIRGRSEDAPNVYLLHGDLTDKELSTLYRHHKIKAFVSMTHGEGFMISGLQFSLTRKPMLLPGYSGHLDYLVPKYPTLKVEEVPIPPSGLPPGMVAQGAKWGHVSDAEAVGAMRSLFANDNGVALAAARSQCDFVLANFTVEAVRKRFIRTVEKHIAEVPFEEEIDLPEDFFQKEVDEL